MEPAGVIRWGIILKLGRIWTIIVLMWLRSGKMIGDRTGQLQHSVRSSGSRIRNISGLESVASFHCSKKSVSQKRSDFEFCRTTNQSLNLKIQTCLRFAQKYNLLQK